MAPLYSRPRRPGRPASAGPRPLWKATRDERYAAVRPLVGRRVLGYWSGMRDTDALSTIEGVVVSVAQAITGAQGSGDFVVIRAVSLAGNPTAGDFALSLATVHSIRELA